MVKMLKNILIVFLLLNILTIKSNSKDITTLLRTQQLTVFDIGIFRLQEDLKSSYPVIKKHKDVPYEDIYIDVVSSYWRNTVDMIVSIPVNENLKSESLEFIKKIENYFEIDSCAKLPKEQIHCNIFKIGVLPIIDILVKEQHENFK